MYILRLLPYITPTAASLWRMFRNQLSPERNYRNVFLPSEIVIRKKYVYENFIEVIGKKYLYRIGNYFITAFGKFDFLFLWRILCLFQNSKQKKSRRQPKALSSYHTDFAQCSFWIWVIGIFYNGRTLEAKKKRTARMKNLSSPLRRKTLFFYFLFFQYFE